MPLFKGKASKAKPKTAIDYATRPDKASIVSSLSMDDSRDYAKQFKETCDMYGKGNGYNERKCYHFKLSIDRADNTTPQQSHELAEKMAQHLFSAHECVIATHTDTDTVHSHIIVNAVSFETGKKLHLSTADKGADGFSYDQIGSYAYCKDLADVLGAEMGFTPLDWRTKTSEKLDRIFNDDAISPDQKNLSQAERNMDKHGNLCRESWKEALRQAIDEAKAHCTDRNQFEQYLQEQFSVTMPRSTGKTVSFVHPAVGETKAIRGNRLGADYTADSIDQALQRNQALREVASLQESASLQPTIERSALNARLFITEEHSTNTDTVASVTTTAPSPTIPVIPSKPTSQDGNRKRSAPRSLSDVGAELRSLDNAVQSIAGRGQSDSGEMDRVAETATAEQSTTVKPAPAQHGKAVTPTGGHEREVQQKPKRRSYSYER